jgi:3-hydroxyisobutyrate dehydrogenase
MAGGMREVAMTSVEMERGRVAVVGLGAMGVGMALTLIRAGFAVAGYDLSDAAVARLVAAGGHGARSPAEAAEGATAVVSVVVNAAQTEAVLFGSEGCAGTMAADAVFISCATMAPDAAAALAGRLRKAGRDFVDAPISGGAKRAADGSLTILASGNPAALDKARPVLRAMGQTLHELGTEPGTAAAFKMINQLLAGVHIAVACEAIAFAAKLGLDIGKVYDVISQAAGTSWMFENRIPHVLDGDYTPLSAVNIFTKDLGIVMDMGRAANFPVPMAATALQLFTMTSAAGMGRDDDSSVARFYAQTAGVMLPHKSAVGGASDQDPA